MKASPWVSWVLVASGDLFKVLFCSSGLVCARDCAGQPWSWFWRGGNGPLWIHCHQNNQRRQYEKGRCIFLRCTFKCFFSEVYFSEVCFKRPSVPSSYISIDTYFWVLIENSSVDVWGKSVLLFVMIWVKANKTEALVPMYAAVFYRSLDRNSAYLDTTKIYLVTPKIYLVSPKTDSVHQQIFGYANNIFRYA